MDPFDVLEEGERALREGRDHEALSFLLWCFDHGPQVEPAFGGVWGSTLPALLSKLGRTYPPANVSLRERILGLENQLTVDTENEWPRARMLASLYDAIGERNRTIQMLERLRTRSNRSSRAELALAGAGLHTLFEASRYDLIVDYADAIAARDRAMLAMNPSPPAEQDVVLKREHVSRGVELYSALLRTGESVRARTFGDELIITVPHAATYATLHEFAKLASSSQEMARISQKAATELPQAGVDEFRFLIGVK